MLQAAVAAQQNVQQSSQMCPARCMLRTLSPWACWYHLTRLLLHLQAVRIRHQCTGSVPRLRQDAPLLRVLGPGVEQQRAPAQQVLKARDGVGLCQRALRVQQAADLGGVIHLPSANNVVACKNCLWCSLSCLQYVSN